LTVASLPVGLVSVVPSAWATVEVEGVVEVAVFRDGGYAFVA